MIINGIVTKNLHKLDYKCISSNNDPLYVLDLNDGNIYNVHKCNHTPLTLSPYVNYIFHDYKNRKFYVNKGQWVVDNDLTVKDDDNKYVYHICHSRIISKCTLLINEVTTSTTTDINSLQAVILLMAPFAEIKLTQWNQVTIIPYAPYPLGAVVNNTNYYLTTTIQYSFYPNNIPDCNKVIVTTILTKTNIIIPLDNMASINFNGISFKSVGGFSVLGMLVHLKCIRYLLLVFLQKMEQSVGQIKMVILLLTRLDIIILQ